jgi:thiamine pyrophosphokinase
LIGASPGSDPNDPDASIAHIAAKLRELEVDPARDLLVGVDGGVRVWLEAGYRPHMAVGDWDSIVEVSVRGGKGSAKSSRAAAEAKLTQALDVLSSIHHLTLHRDKDRSDLFYAAEAVIRAGAKSLICFGVTGGRPDHHLATVLELERLARGESGELTSVAAYGVEGDYHFLSGATGIWGGGTEPFRAQYDRARELSVFALGGDAQGVTLKGLRYELRAARMRPGSHGLSNVTRPKRSFEIRVKTGSLLVILVP